MRLTYALLSVVLLVLPAAASAQQSRGQVVVTGEASTAVAPDTALLRVGISNDGKTAREAGETNARLMAPIIAALKGAGIAEQDIQTAYLSIQPTQEPQRAGPPRISSFRASNQVAVRIRDIAQVAAVIDQAIGAGANEISGVSFMVSEPSQALDQVRDEALADARRKAEIYAKAAGAGLGRAVSIEEDGARGPAPMRAARMEATPVMAGEQILQVSVSVSYELLY